LSNTASSLAFGWLVFWLYRILTNQHPNIKKTN